jgi:pseudouridine synthase
MIAAGRVTVDGRVAHLGDKANPRTQRIELDGVPIRRPEPYVYVMLHKPRGYVTTTDDPHGRRTVLDLVNVPQRLYPVGRLDLVSEGLLLMTNDGTLTQRLTHPKYEHERVYRVLVRGTPDEDTLAHWRRGITLDGRPTRFDAVEVARQEGDGAWLRVTVHEGRKHLVRRMVAALGHAAQRLIRVRMGPLRLGNLRPGRWRRLRDDEVAALQEDVGLAPSARSRRRR